MALMNEKLVGLLPSIADAGSLAIGNGNRMNRIRVLMVEHEDIMVATTGRDMETTSLIGIRLEERLIGKQRNSNMVRTQGKSRSKVVVSIGSGDGVRKRKQPSGTKVLGLLILVTKRSGNRLRKMFANQLTS
jgi:hypothetical protein